MLVKNILDILEDWAPQKIALSKDNIGLQLGNPNNSVFKILIALDVTKDVIEEAIKKNIDLLIVHHPLIFEPLKNISSNDKIGSLIYTIIENKISLIAIHTNLDFTNNGVSFALANKIGLNKIKILKRSKNLLRKIVVFIPLEYTEKILESMALEGAGLIGNYEFCSYRSTGIGTFKGSSESNPFIGKQGEFENVEEIRLEMIVPEWKIENVIKAMKKSHPYEEPAFDIYPTENESNSFGAGAYGIYEEALTPKKFLSQIKEQLGVDILKYTDGVKDKIKTVAVCGGSGIDLLPSAIAVNADAFITADINYHSYNHAEGKIMLIDAGHFETEIPILDVITTYLKNKFAQLKENIQVIQTTQSKNIIKTFY